MPAEPQILNHFHTALHDLDRAGGGLSRIDLSDGLVIDVHVLIRLGEELPGLAYQVLGSNLSASVFSSGDVVYAGCSEYLWEKENSILKQKIRTSIWSLPETTLSLQVAFSLSREPKAFHRYLLYVRGRDGGGESIAARLQRRRRAC